MKVGLGLLIMIYMFMANRIIFRDSWQDLNYLFQKIIHYQHHHDNYQENLDKNKISFGLRSKKQPAIKPTSNNFYTKWNSVLYDTEKKLVEMLSAETKKKVNIFHNESYETVKLRFPIESDEIVLKIKRKNKRLKNTLKTGREKKWKTF